MTRSRISSSWKTWPIPNCSARTRSAGEVEVEEEVRARYDPMRRPWWVILVVTCCLCSLALAAPDGGSGGDELERNRRLLEKWKADPERYQRLKRDLVAFYA